MKNTYVIGDIHGALKGLEQALVRSPLKEGDTIVFLGDYADGWSETAELIEFLIGLKSKYNCIFLRGNHDKWCEDWLLLGHSPLIWIQQGGQATIDSYIKTGYLTEQSHRDFFKALQNYYIDDENRGFVHGGFKSRKGLGHEVYKSDYYWDRDLWQIALLSDGKFHNTVKSDGIENSRRFEKHTEIFIGHTSTINWHYKANGVLRITDTTNPDCKIGKPITTPIQACNVWNMDTGGGFGGKVTIMDVATKKYWQSDFVKDLYPNEKGRG